MTNQRNGTIYCGVTSNLIRRVYEHKTYSQKNCFTAKYQCTFLVYYEIHSSMYNAISREKQIKSCSRKAKLNLIEKDNPGWIDLYNDLCK
jgi:putative endonuclease